MCSPSIFKNFLGEDVGYFMHASTASGQKGNSAWLKTQKMSPNRQCSVQCLQFYYYNSGNTGDELNIWMREFQNEKDLAGTLHLMGQITGNVSEYDYRVSCVSGGVFITLVLFLLLGIETSHWQLQHVSLNATKNFQVEFEVKGAGSSAGGFSIDDINLSEIECPHLTMQFDNFSAKNYETVTYSQRQYSSDGYAYRVATVIEMPYIGLYVQLLSGKYDDQLAWPCPQRQISFQMVDQTPNIQLHMSKQWFMTTDPKQGSNGKCE